MSFFLFLNIIFLVTDSAMNVWGSRIRMQIPHMPKMEALWIRYGMFHNAAAGLPYG